MDSATVDATHRSNDRTQKMTNDQDSRLRSLNHDLIAYITFFNRANFPVDIAWIDYNGKLVRYCSQLQPGGHFHMNTYKTHPWVAWNSETMEKLYIGGDFVYQPSPWQGEQQRTSVFIDHPLLPLLKLCVRRVRSLVNEENVEALEIPQHLYSKLKKKRRREFSERRR